MDIARPDIARAKRRRQIAYGVAGTVAVILITVGVSRLEPAAPRVDRDTVYTDTVQRGEMLRNVRGTGTLVPEEIRWISAITNSTVERIVLRPGVTVEPDTVIVELSNPQLEQSALEARLQLEAAQARYESRQVELDRDVLTQRATVAQAEEALTLAEYEASLDEELYKEELISEPELRQKQAAASPMMTEMRAPKMMRLRTSLPSWSTPIGCCQELPLSLSPTPISLKPYGASNSENTAHAKKIRVMTAPTVPSGFSLIRRVKKSTTWLRRFGCSAMPTAVLAIRFFPC